MFELGVLLAVLAVLGAVARRFALSPIPVYLLAGLSLGNGGILGVAAAGEFIATGAPIGVVLLLLALGLEFSATEFASSLRHHLPSAGVDIVLNAAPGAVAGWLLGLDGVAILGLAGVTYISSSGVIARLLEDLRRLGNRETPAVPSISPARWHGAPRPVARSMPPCRVIGDLRLPVQVLMTIARCGLATTVTSTTWC